MSFDRLKSFWRSSSNNNPPADNSNDASIFDRAQNFISSSISNSFRRSSIPVSNTAEFDDYLAMVATLKHYNRKKHSSTSNTLKPELVKRCYQIVEPKYFRNDFKVQIQEFDRKRTVNMDQQFKMQEQLDEVQVCLFNQITSRFDEILSSLRTLESLSFLVTENQQKLKYIRQQNFQQVMKVTEKQSKMSHLLRKKKNMEYILQKMLQIKNYADFLKLSSNLDSSQTTQQFYIVLPNVKNSILALEKFKATKRVSDRVEEVENSLRRSFSDKVNGQIYEYIKGDNAYKRDFWRKFINLMSIFQDKEMENTAILDQSTYGDEQTVVVLPKREEGIENSILNYMEKGWEDGQYVVGKLKSQIEGYLKSYHNNFIMDFRNFCDEACRSHEREIQNPSLPNLLRELSVTFCAKVYTYFFDIHKSILLRFFALTQKCFLFAINKSKQQLTIEQKDKLKQMANGFVDVAVFLVRIIFEKLIDICESKFIHEGVQLSDFKLIISVLENAEQFIQKQLLTFVHVEDRVSEQSFLGDFFCEVKDRFPIIILEKTKHRKVMDYLNRMHKNALTVELKESLDDEIWQPTDIPTEYYDSLHYLITGESLNLRRNRAGTSRNQPSVLYDTSVLIDSIIQKQQSFYQEPSSMGSKTMSDFRIIRNDIIISGRTYKVTSTVLLMVEILEDYLTLAQNFPIVMEEVSMRMNQIIRSYNSLSCQLIVNAGAVALQKIKSKNITSRHLGLSSLCLNFIIYIMGCIEKRTPIYESQKLRKALEDHIEIIVKKLYQIIMFKSTGAQKQINLQDTPSKGTATIVNNTKILLEILSDYFDKNTLGKIFTGDLLKIYLDGISCLKITSRIEAESLKDDVAFFFGELKGLESITEDFVKYRIQAQDVVRVGFEEL